MAQLTTYGNQTLPSDGNVAKGDDKDIAAMITALQNLSKIVTFGTGAPSGAVSTPTIRIRTDGTSVTSISINPGGNSWNQFSASAVVV